MPVLIDITAPQNPYAVINHGAFMTNSPDVAVTISTTDLRPGNSDGLSHTMAAATRRPNADIYKQQRGTDRRQGRL